MISHDILFALMMLIDSASKGVATKYTVKRPIFTKT